MEQLLGKSKIDKIKLKNYINKVVAEELGKLNEPCYVSPYKNYYGEEILYLTGLTVKDIREFSKKFHVERLAPGYLLKDWITNTLLFTLHYFLLQKDVKTFMSIMILLCINFYSHTYFKFFKFCNPEIFKYTLDNISKNNLMSREKTIPNFLYFISKEMLRRYKKDIETMDNPERISEFIYECRHRINQTFRSFAELYYKYSKEGIKGYGQSEKEGSEGTYEIETLKKGERIIEDVTSKITIYKEIDRKAFEDAKKLSRANVIYAEYILKSLSDVKYSDDIKLIYELFVRELESLNELCGKDFFKFTRDLMGIKRTTKVIYYKKQVIDLTNKILLNSKYEKSYQKLTDQTKFITQSFTSFYLALYFRNKVC